jgi:hypothetical protein
MLKHAQEVISKTRQKKQKNSIPFVSILPSPSLSSFDQVTNNLIS